MRTRGRKLAPRGLGGSFVIALVVFVGVAVRGLIVVGGEGELGGLQASDEGAAVGGAGGVLGLEGGAGGGLVGGEDEELEALLLRELELELVDVAGVFGPEAGVQQGERRDEPRT